MAETAEIEWRRVTLTKAPPKGFNDLTLHWKSIGERNIVTVIEHCGWKYRRWNRCSMSDGIPRITGLPIGYIEDKLQLEKIVLSRS